jgi:hypothetical protein
MGEAQRKRRLEAYAAVSAELSAAGIALVTKVDEYGGLRSVAQYRLEREGANGEVREATILRLKRMALGMKDSASQ